MSGAAARGAAGALRIRRATRPQFIADERGRPLTGAERWILRKALAPASSSTKPLAPPAAAAAIAPPAGETASACLEAPASECSIDEPLARRLQRGGRHG